MSLCLRSPAFVLAVVSRRCLATPTRGLESKPAKVQLKPHGSTDGFFNYRRDVSRDSRYANSAKPGDTAIRALSRKLGHAYEVYPIFFLVGFWFCIFCFAVYHSFEKVEVWLDRSQDKAPWDWERIRNNYWKKPTVVFDRSGITHQRLEIMEALQDEMLEAAKKRGTRH